MKTQAHHSWPLFLAYHRCPHCGRIVEDRQSFQKNKKKEIKEVVCDRCKISFTIERASRNSLLPLFRSDTSSHGINWEQRK